MLCPGENNCPSRKSWVICKPGPWQIQVSAAAARTCLKHLPVSCWHRRLELRRASVTLQRGPASCSRSVTETDSLLKAVADCCSPEIDPPKAPKCFATTTRRRREVRTVLQTPRGRAEEGAGDAHVVVVGRADVHHQVGGRAQPAPAAEGVASPRRQKVGARDVPREGAQGHGVALQLEASHREAGQGHGALAVGARQEVAQRGQGGLQQHLAQGGQRDVVGSAVEELVLQQRPPCSPQPPSSCRPPGLRPGSGGHRPTKDRRPVG